MTRVDRDSMTAPLGEDIWTTPHDPDSIWCTHPGDWHAWDDEATEVEVTEMVGALVRATQPQYVLETGSYDGQTSQVIGEALQSNGHGHLVTIEWDKDLAAQTSERCQNLPVTTIHGNVADWVPEQTIDFAFIDAGPDRIDQWVKLLPHVAPHTIFVVHDTAPHHVVWRTIEPHIAAGRFTALNIHSPRGVAICQVP